MAACAGQRVHRKAADERTCRRVIEVGLVLFVITLIVNSASRVLIWQMNRPPQRRVVPLVPAPTPAGDQHDALRRPAADLTPRRLAVWVLGRLASCWLAIDLFFVVSRGVVALNLDFFTHMPVPVGEAGGGMANAIVGMLMIVGLGALMAVPVGGDRGRVSRRSSPTRVSRVLSGSPRHARTGAVDRDRRLRLQRRVLPFIMRRSPRSPALSALGVMMIPIIKRHHMRSC